MKEKLEAKTNLLITAVTSDPRWDLQDELMMQVLGFTLYGYAVGIGRVILFMEMEEIDASTITQLTNLGVGPKYAEGLIEVARNTFAVENDESVYSQLVGVGHSHIASEELDECVDSIFENTETLRGAQA